MMCSDVFWCVLLAEEGLVEQPVPIEVSLAANRPFKDPPHLRSVLSSCFTSVPPEHNNFSPS